MPGSGLWEHDVFGLAPSTLTSTGKLLAFFTISSPAEKFPLPNADNTISFALFCATFSSSKIFTAMVAAMSSPATEKYANRFITLN